MTAASLLILALLSGLPISGGGLCPAPERVAALLEAEPWGEGYQGRLTEGEGGLEVALIDPDGEVIAARTLAVKGECDALAAAAAVMLRTWRAELATRAPAAPRLPPRPQPRFALEAELLGSGSSVRRFPSYGFAARGRISFQGPAFGLLALGWASPRTLPVAGGEVVFQRLAPLLSVGAGLETRIGWATTGAEASLGVARLSLAGVGLENSRGAWALDLGLGAGLQVRAHLPGTPLQPYLGLRGLLWATRHRALVGAVDSVLLPQHELQLAAGVQFSLSGG